MNDKVIKEALSYALGAELHEAWCMQELHAFFTRAQKEYEKSHIYGAALEKACYKGEDKRNEVEIDVPYLVGHETLASRCIKEFNVFMELFRKGIITVKRFTKRKLTPDEVTRIGSDYKDGKENILREFSTLSSASQKDNLEAARVVIELVYDKIMAGKELTPEEIEKIAAIVHDEWLKRNSWVFDKNYGNPKLAVPYEQLPKDEQDKDKDQIELAQTKVAEYATGLINIKELCEKYGIPYTRKSL